MVVPFTIACGNCWQCRHDNWSLCENSNPNAALAEKMMGHAASGAFGYSHLTGGFAGGQAEFARVPFADVGPLKIENGFADEQVLFLSDILPTGYMGAEMCDIQPGDTIAVWGCGPVGLFAIKSAYLLGAERVIAIDRFDYRLEMARTKCGAETVNYEQVDSVPETLKEMTAGRGPDACIDAVGLEAHGHGFDTSTTARSRPSAWKPTGRLRVREAIMACRNGGTVSIIGVYGGAGRQVPARHADEPLADDQDRAVSRAPLHAAAAGAHRERRDRSDRWSSPTACRLPTRRRATTFSSTRRTTAKKS